MADKANQTNENKKPNREENKEDTLLDKLYPVWQGHVESNHDLRFWRPLY